MRVPGWAMQLGRVAGRGRICVAFAAAFALCLSMLAPALAAEPKALKGVALIIGQSDYKHVDLTAGSEKNLAEAQALLADLN